MDHTLIYVQDEAEHQVSRGPMVKTRACHARNPGSIPGEGVFCCGCLYEVNYWCMKHVLHRSAPASRIRNIALAYPFTGP